MSSILLSNPFVTPAPPAQSPSAEPQTALAITPSQGATGAGGSSDASSFSGNGSGFGGRDGAQAIITRVRNSTSQERPFEATPLSVVTAQTQNTDATRESANPFGTNLPNVDMPDPLPTSPFLKRA